jgi:hypothetical protein
MQMRTMNKVVILLVSLGLILGSATVRAATPLPLRQVENAATVSEQIATAKSAPPTLAEHFRRDEGRWDLASSEAVERLFATSTLRLNIIAQQTVGWSISEFSATDFYLEVDAFHVTGPLDNEFGVVFRYQDDENFYLFATSSDGYYTVQKMEAGEWSELIEWADAEAINQGEAAGNTLGVLADGSRITVSINGELVGAVEDESFASGQIGLLAGSFDDGGVEIAFDDLLLWDLAGEPAPEPTPSPTEEVTSTEEATPTAVPSDLAETLDAIRATEPLLSDDFRTDTGAWPTTTDDDVTYSYARRTYQLEIHTANWLGFAFNTAIEERPIPNLLAEVDITQAAGPAAAEYGLLFHYQDSDNFYMAAISGQGTYGVWKKIDAEWATLIDWTESDLLDTEAETTHRLSLLVQGDQITLLVNDAVLAEVQDEATIVGTIGLVAGAFDEPGVVAAFDNFEVWQLEGETPTLDQTPELGPTPEPENTPEPVDVSARLAEIQATDPTFTEDFRRDEGVWSTTADDQSEFFYERRTYHILVNVTGWMSWQFPEPALEPPPADFLAEVDVEHVAGPTNGEYGLIFRYVDQQNFYFYAISGLGTYSLWKKVDDEWQTLIDWTESPALVAGEGAINRIGVLAEGATITLLANETSVAQFEDESFAAGAVGLAAGTFDEAGLEVAFDNLDLWVITTGTAGDRSTG